MTKPTAAQNSGDVGKSSLATTALEATWDTSQPIVFLGGWCLRYSRMHVWKPLEYSVLPYHWDDRAEIPRDLEYINIVYEAVLPALARTLNEIHGVHFSLRYWRTVVGYWLFYFAQVFFDRWQSIMEAERTNSALTLSRLPQSPKFPASFDVASFIDALQDDTWNERLYADIAENWTGIDIVSAPSMSGVTNGCNSVNSAAPAPARRSFRKVLLEGALSASVLQRRIPRFARQEVSLHASYLGYAQQWKLELLLAQMPSITSSRSLSPTEPKEGWRAWTIPFAARDRFSAALIEAVPRYLPTCYLEGYQGARKEALASGWPKSPRVAMTANAFASDDRWKLWAAEACDSGSKLVLAQHGGHYGSGLWSASQMHEIATSDRYLSWGWVNPLQPKVRSAPATKLIGKKKFGPRSSGICLQVTTSAEQQSGMLHSFPIAYQIESYLQDQLLFASALSPAVRRDLVVRLPRQDFDWSIAQRWRDSDPSISVDSGTMRLNKLLKRTKLYVATYNATTFLESFTQEIPTVMFWDPKYWELCEDAVPFFNLLRESSILFDDPLSCADHVNSIWGDVPQWWASGKVQAAVSAFKAQYANVGHQPLRELRAGLTSW